MQSIFRAVLIAIAAGLCSLNMAHADGAKHRIVIHVDQNDPEIMNLALNNAKAVIDAFRAKNEDVNIEVVAYGPGLHMLRDDTSPVKDRIKEISELSFPSNIAFSACNNTKQGMEKREGHPITIIAQAHLVPAGVVRIMELEEQGYSYVKP
jgi:intracellular sulfur oxidation DsrE/DsrF family protein